MFSSEPSTAPEQLSAKAYAKIKDAIISCVLPPGGLLSQSQIENMVGMGKAPVRTALTLLRREELVIPVSRKGYRISPVTMQDVENMFQVRMLLEAETIRLAASRITKGELSQLAKLSKVTFQRGNKDSERNFVMANKEFHSVIAHASGNARLARMFDQLLEEGMRIIFLTMSTIEISDTWQVGHQEIYKALERRDAKRAAEIAHREIDNGLQSIARAVLSNSSIAQTNILPLER